MKEKNKTSYVNMKQENPEKYSAMLDYKKQYYQETIKPKREAEKLEKLKQKLLQVVKKEEPVVESNEQIDSDTAYNLVEEPKYIAEAVDQEAKLRSYGSETSLAMGDLGIL
jgi:hypothetical protein